MTTHHTLKKWYHSGKTLDVQIDVEGYTGHISDQTLKGIADLLYNHNTDKLHKSDKVVGIATNQNYIHEVDSELLEVKSYKVGVIDKTAGTVTTAGSITIGKTGSVNAGKHKFK